MSKQLLVQLGLSQLLTAQTVHMRDENRSRYPNIKWYLDAVGLDFQEVITAVNAIPRLADERFEQ